MGQLKMDLLTLCNPRFLAQWLGSSVRPPLVFHGVPSHHPPDPQRGTVRRILWVRTDAIGDAVLAMDQLRGIAARHPSAEIHIACQTLTATLYSACPFQATAHPFDRGSFRKHTAYRRDYLRRIKDLGVDLAVNGVFSRETLSDAVTLASGAPIRVSWRGDDSQAKASRLRFLDDFYTHQLDGTGAPALEILRNQQFLEFLGCGLADYQPRIWLSEADEAYADNLLRSHCVDPRECIALFPGAQRPERAYNGYGQALRVAFPAGGPTLIALGGSVDRDSCEQAIKDWGGPSLNLCGTTTILQAAALIARCKLGFGAETGSAHIATALGTPVVVLLGGGHFGRFMPYAASHSAAVLPLNCFNCNWRCPFERIHCVQDVDPALLARALHEAWEASSERARIYRSAALPSHSEAKVPRPDPAKSMALVDAQWIIV